MADSEFTLSNGRKLKIRSVSPFMLSRISPSVLKEYEIDIPPFYTAETVGGGTQEFPHDETTLEVEDDPQQTAINQAMWSEYKRKSVLASLETNRRFLRLLLMRGVDIELPEDEAWLDDHKALGLDIPEDPADLRIMYIQDELVNTRSDWNRLVDEIMALSDITEDDVAAATDSFLDQVEGAETQQGDQPGSEG